MAARIWCNRRKIIRGFPERRLRKKSIRICSSFCSHAGRPRYATMIMAKTDNSGMICTGCRKFRSITSSASNPAIIRRRQAPTDARPEFTLSNRSFKFCYSASIVTSQRFAMNFFEDIEYIFGIAQTSFLCFCDPISSCLFNRI